MLTLVFVAVLLIFLFKILNVNNYPEKSLLYSANVEVLEAFLKRVPELSEPYIPTRFWGFSGHIQTIIQGVISRLHCPLVNGHRIYLKLTDGATVSYDLYQSVKQHPEGGDFTLAVCPGIGNNSESVYIRRIVFNAQKNGYRIAVLNHIGTLATVPVTSPRIFNYGNTSDYAAMVKDVVRRYRNTRIVVVGFSMGGNLVTKYIGEPRVKPSNVIAGISVCQGYDAYRAVCYLLEWKGFRRMYIYAMTENIKAIIRRWTPVLFHDDVKRVHGINERQVFNAGTLFELDDLYTRKVSGFNNIQDFYRSMSCCHHLKNIKIPMVFLNSLDDPVVPPPLLEIIRDAALKNDSLIYIEQKFGGHLGFYEGGVFRSNPLTWQDRIIVKIGHALVAGHCNKDIKAEYEDVADFRSTLLSPVTSNTAAPLAPPPARKTENIPFFETPVTSELSDVDGESDSAPALDMDSDALDNDSDALDNDSDVQDHDSASFDTDSDKCLDEDSDSFPEALNPPNSPVPRNRYKAIGLNIFPEA